MLPLVLAFALGAQAPPPSLERTLGSVVLLITTLDGGLSGYGAGIVLDGKGFVLTNLHVLDGARAVYALTWDPEAPSYAGVDGGLARVVFEREKDLIPVTMIRGDPILDLAVVRLDKPASVVIAKLQSNLPTVGDAVIAVGHPEQNFWSVTRGQVNGLHQGLIQHDAAINKGNSGGPLFNAAGEVIGINTSFIKSAQGIFYARPLALASKLVDHVSAPLILDRSTPEKAVLSCARARELASPAFAECIHWGSHYAWFRDLVLWMIKPGGEFQSRVAAEAPALRGGPKARATKPIRAWLAYGDGRADVWVKHYASYVMAFFTSDDPAQLGLATDQMLTFIYDGSRGGRAAKKPAVAASRSMGPVQLRAALVADKNNARAIENEDGHVTFEWDVEADRKFHVATGLKTDVRDMAAMRRTLKMGLRVERVQLAGADRAWVLVAGRNLDGSGYRVSILMSRESDGWREHLTTFHELKARVKPPSGFPPLLGFTETPLGMAIGGAVTLGFASIADLPDGVTFDGDFEHKWPIVQDIVTSQALSVKAVARAAAQLKQ